ncbi:restriction endonuclease subunit S [Iodobacter sp. HSC-16F04]|uniref:Restriction endonuclease subunit S n=1 Tax=Iodobacter violaceini TaxID=3044271 RepID=A0ABX0L7H7_9NEIS|nr:restriction endonuclease subunit S [Iodobacter violacea]NHQ88578.1 restriction endonuclease subunit S [Iodobacter violacea]
MSRYQAYAEYKDSGVEWIGNIPTDWDMWKIAHACPYVASGTTPKSDGEIYYGSDNLWVTTGELREDVIFDTQKKVTDKALIDLPTLRVHPKGSVAIAMYGATIGRLGIFGNAATTNQACCVMPPSEILHNKYLFYWLYATRQEIINLSSGGGQPNVNQEKIASLKVSAPTFLQQENIANFLDHETAKIDLLIEKQQALIELLKEKRLAIISRAVTKGLNPNAPMKDSGVEWLGEVPEHWGLTPLKYLCSFSGGGTPSKENLSYWTDGNIPWVSPKDMKSFWISDSQDKITETAVKESSTNFVEVGSLLMVVRSGILQRTIPIAINTVKVTLNQDMKALSFNSRIDVEYAANYILGNTESLLLEWSKEGATVESIEHEYLASSIFPVPPKEEQKQINATIQARMETFSALEENARKGISLLQERRTALISAAVTGKIDVRDWQAPN